MRTLSCREGVRATAGFARSCVASLCSGCFKISTCPPTRFPVDESTTGGHFTQGLCMICLSWEVHLRINECAVAKINWMCI